MYPIGAVWQLWYAYIFGNFKFTDEYYIVSICVAVVYFLVMVYGIFYALTGQ